MRLGELFAKDLERWRERGLIRVIPLQGRLGGVRAEKLASLPVDAFTGFAPLREDHDVVRVARVRPIE